MNDDSVVSLLETVGKHGFQFAIKLVVGNQGLVHKADVPVDREIGVVVQRVERCRRCPVEPSNIEGLTSWVFLLALDNL